MATRNNGKYKANRKRLMRLAQQRGITHCPGWEDTNGTHHHCGNLLDYQNSRQPNSAEADHIIPVKWGGTDDLNNLTILCRSCNNARSDLTRTPKPQTRPHHYTTSRTW
jgi:5-methylcytosine-specific restriction endonuclease McrA